MSRPGATRASNISTEFVELFNSNLENILGLPQTRMANKIPIDMTTDEKTIYIYADIPGVHKENITIDFANNKLTIKVDREKPYEEGSVTEIRAGHFERVITLPICITRRETVSVSYTDGVLKIKINKLIEQENNFSVKFDST